MTASSRLLVAFGAVLLTAAPPVRATAAAPAAPPPPAPLARGEIVDPVQCEGFPGQTYALYLPRTYTKDRAWPVLYTFDARQNGRAVAELYREAAERLGWIIVSSNYARSDEEMEPNVAAMKAMWEDSHARFAIDPKRVYATGHSGGARAACVLGTLRAGEVAGVIGHGGGFPFNWPPSKETRFAFYGLAGNLDFNFPELLELDRTLDRLGLDHHFESFEGPHAWSPPAEAGMALEWMELLAMRQGTAPRRPELVDAIWSHFSALARKDEATDPVATLRRLEALVRDFSGLRPEAEIAAVKAGADALRAAPATQQEIAEQAAIEREQQVYLTRARGRLASILQDIDASSPAAAARELEIGRLHKEAEKAPSQYARLAAQRSLNTLWGQTIFYLPREFANRKDWAHAIFLLGIANEIKPDTVGGWYSLAAMRARSGDGRGAVSALKRAREYGRLEARWLEQDGDFDGVRGRGDFQSLLAELRAQKAS